jgi:hypothetical protein
VVESALSVSAAFESYQGDPVGFCETTFGETYTDDVKKMMESVRDNPVTIAKSANQTGKSHGAARVAVWFAKCFPDAQVYTAAAPPEDNLRRILWGEIGNLAIKHKSIFSEFSHKNMHLERNPRSFITGVTIPQARTDA